MELYKKDYLTKEEGVQLGKDAVRHSWKEGISNILYFGIGFILILFIGSKFPMFGKIGFWVYAVLAGFDFLRLFFASSMEILYYFKPKFRIKNDPSFRKAILIQTTFEIAMFFYTLELYRTFLV